MINQDAWREIIEEYGLDINEKERAVFNALPDTITVYRGYCDEHGTKEGFSWTMDRAVAERFVNGHGFAPKPHTNPTIVERVVSKQDVWACLLDREEVE